MFHSRFFKRVGFRIFGRRYSVWLDRIRRKRIDRGRRSGEFISTIDLTFALLEFRELLPTQLIALELFGRCGLWKTVEYVGRCLTLDFYELNPTFAAAASRYLPSKVVTVHCEDSIRAVISGKIPRKDYNFILLDHTCGQVFGDDYCEHFDLFPRLFDYLGKEAIIVANVFRSHKKPDEFAPQYLKRRKEFYGVASDAEAVFPSSEVLERTYRAVVPHQWQLRNLFFVPHPFQLPTEMYFVVLAVRASGNDLRDK